MSFTCTNWKLQEHQRGGVSLYSELTEETFGVLAHAIVIPESSVRIQYREILYLNTDTQERIFRSREGFSVMKITKLIQDAYLKSFPKRKDFDPNNPRHGGTPHLISLVPHDHKKDYYLAWIEHR